MSPQKSTVPWWISMDSPQEKAVQQEREKRMSRKVKVVRAYVGWKEEGRPALNDGRTEVYSDLKPMMLRGDSGVDHDKGGSLADALDSVGAQYGDDLIVVAGSKEKINEDILVLDLSHDDILEGLDLLIQEGSDVEDIIRFLRSVSVQS
jgi:hypothetical protein